MVDQNTFEEWVILELMGHRRLAGKVTDAVIGGGAFIRIDIPTKDDQKITQFYAPGAVYCISPTTKEIATMVAINSEPEPISKWELRPMLSQGKPEEPPC